MRIGIFFGGPSREREIAFAGGRTIYDNLDKSLFEAIPIFVDSFGNFIELDWKYVYKGTIRDFYPPVEFLPADNTDFQYYIECLGPLGKAKQTEICNSVGTKLTLEDIQAKIDFAFLSMHGEFGEDGQIQGLLETIKVPYSGSGIRACAIGMDKGYQKKLMAAEGFDCPSIVSISKEKWSTVNRNSFIAETIEAIKYPVVIRPANQGSSIGVAILDESNDQAAIAEAIDAAFFTKTITATEWNSLSQAAKKTYLTDLIDLRSGVGLPIKTADSTLIYDPNQLQSHIEETLSNSLEIKLEGQYTEQEVIVESFIKGKEFSCVVIQDNDGSPIALPPTEIVKGGEVFDYRSKYLAGLSRKITPIDLPDAEIEAIRLECEKLYDFLSFNVYARIDGFITDEGKIFLNDPNTTSGMLPSSFFFHQAAEIGLNPSQFITYIIYTSLQERIRTAFAPTNYDALLQQLEDTIAENKAKETAKTKVGVFLGGYSFERHISVESGRNIYEKLASSDKYEPQPIFLSKKGDSHTLHQIPINLMLKDNADDILDKITHFSIHPVIEKIKKQCQAITDKFTFGNVVYAPKELSYDELKETVDQVFVALHGRPGEDGNVQKKLDEIGLSYNGSSPTSSSVTIHKYNTLQQLKAAGFIVTDQYLAEKSTFTKNETAYYELIETKFDYPFIAKPVDDGCSSAVKKIDTRAELEAYVQTVYRNELAISPECQAVLALKDKEEFPQKEDILFEALIAKGDAVKFLEITGGFLTHHKDGKVAYELFEPSEALATGDILSLEEKFLAGQGQNLTPSRFEYKDISYDTVATQVKQTLQEAAILLGVEGYARIDAFVRIYPDGKAETIIIEVNSLPGMTPATCIFHQCALNGYKPYNFIDQILDFGLKRTHG